MQREMLPSPRPSFSSPSPFLRLHPSHMCHVREGTVCERRTDILTHPPDGLWLWRKERRDGVSKGIAAVASFIVNSRISPQLDPKLVFMGTQRSDGRERRLVLLQ